MLIKHFLYETVHANEASFRINHEISAITVLITKNKATAYNNYNYGENLIRCKLKLKNNCYYKVQ